MAITLRPTRPGARAEQPSVRISSSGALYLNSSLAQQLSTPEKSRYAVEVDVANNQVRLVPATDGYASQRQSGHARQIRCRAVTTLLAPHQLDRTHPARVEPNGVVVVEVTA